MTGTALQDLVQDCVVRHGAFLIDLVVQQEGHTTLVEVFVDAEDAITSDRCSSIGRDIAETLDDRKEFAGPYRLTVSSPGIDRPLKYPWQCSKHIGRLMQITTRSGDADVVQVGRVSAVDDAGVVLEVGTKGDRVPIAFQTVIEAKVKAPW